MFLFLFALSQLIYAPHAFAQQNRTELIYPFGKVLISNCDLPDKVYKQQKKKMMIEVIFTKKEEESSSSPLVFSGTGEVVAPGIIVTNRHVLMNGIQKLVTLKYDYILDKSGFPQGVDYNYQIFGIIMNEFGQYSFPLHLKAIEKFDSARDVMALEIDVDTRVIAEAEDQALDQYGNLVPNPYKMLIQPLTFTDKIAVADPVYVSGFTGDGYVDIIDFTFCGQLSAPIRHMPVNKDGVKLFYRFYGEAEYGFSGGPAFNKDGEVIGISTQFGGDNFLHILSAEDIKEFLKENKIK